MWSQIKRTAVTGAMKGLRLELLAMDHTTWADWHARHLDTQVLSTDTGYARDYGRDPYAGYDKVQRLMFDVAHRDDRFEPKEWVLGVEIGSIRKAYPFSVLAQAVNDTGTLHDTVGTRRLRIR